MKKIILMILSVLTAGIFCGCSKPAPDMNTVRVNLVLDIFELVKREKHAESVVKIRKLRELDPTSIYLPELESVEIANSDLQKVDRLLMENKRTEAAGVLQSVIQRRGLSAGANRTAEKLKDVIRMEQLVDIMIAPAPDFKGKFRPASVVICDASAEFRQLAKRWNVSKNLQRKALILLRKVPAMQEAEIMRSNTSLDLFAMTLSGYAAETMDALKEYSRGTKMEFELSYE